MVSKGKGKRGSFHTGCAARTPEGRPICFAFNKKGEGCKNETCQFSHVCGICFRKGLPMYSCKHDVLQ